MLEIVELLHKVNAQLLKIMIPLIKNEGISPSEMIILRKVYLKGTYRAMDLARDTDLPPSTITGIVDRLVARNYVIRINDAEDRRSVLVQGTPNLKKVMEEIESACDRKLKDVFKNIPTDVMEGLIKDLSFINQYLEDRKGPNPEEEG